MSSTVGNSVVELVGWPKATTRKIQALLLVVAARLRPLTHAGVPGGASRSEMRQLVTANVVIILSILVTIPDIWVFLSARHIAATYAGIAASVTVCLYIFAFILVALGSRGIGVFVFSNAVFLVVAVNTVITGTQVGIQYYFVAIAIGAMFVWPRIHGRMRYIQGGIGLALFFIAMTMAHPDPIFGPPLPHDAVVSMLRAHIIGAYLAAFGIAAYSVYVTEDAEQALEIERQKSESLLLNILPEAIATRLKESSRLIADGFDSVTIMFADIVDFTPMSVRFSPVEVVDFLNQLFSRFDALAEKYGLEKIKTIGDAYMVVGGIPAPRSDHAHAVADMALEMERMVREIRTPGGDPVSLRIGINTGPAIAGVIGTKKFSYDLWGDSVNTASRMESHGIPGSIQVSERTYNELKGEFQFEERGAVSVKGKGTMTLYFLRGRRIARSASGAAE